jgi:hypothetical protein
MHWSEVSGKRELAKRGLLSLPAVPVLLPGLGVKGDEHEVEVALTKSTRSPGHSLTKRKAVQKISLF